MLLEKAMNVPNIGSQEFQRRVSECEKSRQGVRFITAPEPCSDVVRKQMESEGMAATSTIVEPVIKKDRKVLKIVLAFLLIVFVYLMMKKK